MAENIWKKCLEYVAISDIGLRRSNNQDSHSEMLAGDQRVWNQRGHIFVVADGMGGHAAGELASKMAADIIPVAYQKKTMTPPAYAAVEAVQEANVQIFTKGNADDNLRGMGTTCDVLVILPEGAMFAHVGDSRAYRLRGNKLEQMTADHSLVWELEAEGISTEHFAQKNVITRCLGKATELKVDVEGPWPYMPGDTFLLCSDGLSGQFPDDSEMGAILAVLPLPEATQALVDLANLRGGPDNITATTVKVLGPQQLSNTVSAARETILAQDPVPAWIWAALGVLSITFLLMLALVFKGTAYFLLTALLALLSAGGVTGIILYLLQRKAPSAFEGKRYGHAPYRSYAVGFTAEFTQKLVDMYAELRESAEEQSPNSSWKRVDGLKSAADKAIQARNYEEAIRNVLRALSAIWKELRG